MTKVKKEESLMDKIEEAIKPLVKLFEEPPQTRTKKEAPKNISSGDELLDNAFKKALRNKKK
jgi:hypothetical protein